MLTNDIVSFEQLGPDRLVLVLPCNLSAKQEAASTIFTVMLLSFQIDRPEQTV